MTTAIRKHLGDFVAILVLFVIAIGVAGYILEPAAAALPAHRGEAVQAQGRALRRAGGDPGPGPDRARGRREGRQDREGRARGRRRGRRRWTSRRSTRRPRSPTTRPRCCARTGLKDMFVELDPGPRRAARGRRPIPVANTAPDIDPDEILSALDTDTRDYLQLLINGAGKGLKGRGNDLREVFARFGPLHRDLARVTAAIAERRDEPRAADPQLRRSLVDELGDKDRELRRLVDASNDVFEAFASRGPEHLAGGREAARRAATRRSDTLAKVDATRRCSGRRSSRCGRRSASSTTPTARCCRSSREAEPILRDADPPVRARGAPVRRATCGRPRATSRRPRPT